MKFHWIFVVFTILSSSLYSQDYLRYYQLTDSAYYYSVTKMNIKADSLYEYAFNQYIGFPRNYINAACNIWLIDSTKSLEYISQAFKYGAYLDNIKYAFEKKGLTITDSILKRLSKESKEEIKCKKCARIINRMGRKDRWARFLFNWRIKKVDNQNREKIILFATKDTMMLNRFYTGIHVNMFMSPLLNHQNWETVGDIFPILRKYVRKGWMHRELLNFFLDEKAFFGQEFKYDSLKDQVFLGSKTKEDLLIKKYFHYSATGQYSLYHPKFRKQVTIPTDPEKSMEEIDALRRALFLSPLSLYKKSYPNKLYPSIDEIKAYFLK